MALDDQGLLHLYGAHQPINIHVGILLAIRMKATGLPAVTLLSLGWILGSSIMIISP